MYTGEQIDAVLLRASRAMLIISDRIQDNFLYLERDIYDELRFKQRDIYVLWKCLTDAKNYRDDYDTYDALINVLADKCADVDSYNPNYTTLNPNYQNISGNTPNPHPSDFVTLEEVQELLVDYALLPDRILTGLEYSYSAPTATISAGTYKINNVEYSAIQTSFEITPTTTGLLKYVRFYATVSGTILSVESTPSSVAEHPSIPDGTLGLYEILVNDAGVDGGATADLSEYLPLSAGSASPLTGTLFGTSASLDGFIDLTNTGGGIISALVSLIFQKSESGVIVFRNGSPGFAEFARITPNGNLQVGYIADLGYKLAINGSSLFTGNAQLNGVLAVGGGGFAGTAIIQVGGNAGLGKISVGGSYTEMNTHSFDDYSLITPTLPDLGYGVFDASTQMSGTTANDHFIAYQARQYYSGSGSIGVDGRTPFTASTNSFLGAFYSNMRNDGTGRIWTASGLTINDIGGSGPVSDSYGIAINNITRGDRLNYAIYTNLGAVRFGDDVTVDAPDANAMFLRNNTGIVGGSSVDLKFGVDNSATSTNYSAMIRVTQTNSTASSVAFHTFNGANRDERMRLTHPGNLLIGTTTDNTTDKLQVNGSASIAGTVSVANPTADAHAVNKGYADATYKQAEFGLACSDETTDLTSGTAKVTFRIPYAMTITSISASVNTAPVGSTLVVDINENGTSILSTNLSIDAGEKTSTTAAVPYVLSDTAIAADSEITIDIDQVGASTAGKGLKVFIIGTRN